jgi:predicted transcriptional regulator
VETSHKRRDRLYIIAEVLVIAKEGTLKTQIMYRANLSFAQLNEYLSFLLQIGLLEKTTRDEKTIYKITPKGTKYLENYEEITSLLSKEEKNPTRRNSPVFWMKKNPMGYR